jgi:DNA polymerase-3 subunit delta'
MLPEDSLPSPHTTSDLIGHDAAEQAFLDAWVSGRLAHAWLICGPRGIGKATLAFRIARFVLSGGGESGGLFGRPPETLAVEPDHPVFRRLASGGHADFRVVERSWTDDKKTRLRTEIPVDDVRDVGAFLSLTPAEGGWRVVIVDAVDDLNRSGANAILKVLEEPPRKALLLLVSHSPGRLLATIRSRCRRLVLKPLGDADVVAALRRRRPDLAEADAGALAQMAAGSIGKALALEAEGGLELYRDMVGLLSGLPQLDVAALHAFADKVAKGDEAFRVASELFAWWVATAITGTARGESDAREVIIGEGPLRRRLISAGGLDRWVEVWEKTSHLFSRADAVNLDRKLVILNAFLALERLGRP